MKVLYASDPLTIDDLQKDYSIFLVGPTPRTAEFESWRPEAIKILFNLGFNGLVLVPEREDWNKKFGYDDQIEWEQLGLQRCSRIVCWVPRVIPGMLGLTTNFEMGYYIGKRPESIYYGRPIGAPQTAYLDWFYSKHIKKPIYHTLESLLKASLES